ncbi:FAD-dependent oxidoreductase [archaeon]|jgi:ferredoxin-NADP reductase|nr:FAD-dependent oxidoreductase [archaeon]MBT3731058.1 FAD-dependent oxidoreductase [archaeon]MBT4670171.1 FAD-dependent oxidoreductase [archaeon]MBT5030539.1 FAD-dependent oxidoreductase [archaeon]MBT5287892.1 FAD-dependent oxidoreductase [archaeon]
MKNFESEILEKIEYTEDVILLKLSSPDDFTFEAGQFITIEIDREEKKEIKSYSILNPPSEKGITLCIRLIPGGFASEFFKDVKQGEKLYVKGPLGFFKFQDREDIEEFCFLAVGTGIVPMISMIKEHVEDFPNKKFSLIVSYKLRKNMLHHEELFELEKKYPNFEYHPSITREEWDGKKGRVTLHLPEVIKGKMFYICGLKEMVLDTRKTLVERGVDQKDIKQERFS